MKRFLMTLVVFVGVFIAVVFVTGMVSGVAPLGDAAQGALVAIGTLVGLVTGLVLAIRTWRRGND